MSGFGATGVDDENDGVIANANLLDDEEHTSAAADVNPSGSPILDDSDALDEPETLDVKEARRLAALPADELLLEVENGDASPKTKLFAVSMRLEQHQAQFDRLTGLKETLANKPLPWWREYMRPSGHRMVDSRFRAFAKDKARAAFRDSGGHGAFAVVDTAREAVRFAANQVLDRLARRLLALADRFR